MAQIWDNILVVATEVLIKLIKINNTNYEIIKEFKIELLSSNSYSIYIMDNKIFFSYCSIEKIGNEFVFKELSPGECLFYREKCKFKDWDLEIWTQDEENYFIHLSSIKNNQRKEFYTPYFTNDIKRNQQLIIEPSYAIVGNDEFLFDLNEKDAHTSKDDHIIQKKLLIYEDRYTYSESYYQSLSKTSFLYLNTKKYLHQFNIIKKQGGFDFEKK